MIFAKLEQRVHQRLLLGKQRVTMADHWVENHKRDSWRKQAKASGYRARSAFKLKQIQQRWNVIREGDVVFDVGCHPGGWAQVAVEEAGETGFVLGVDLQACQPVEGATLIMGDITDSHIQSKLDELLDGRKMNSIISDISPHITGKWDVDQAVAMNLVSMVFDYSLPHLSDGGSFVTKLFQGVGVDELIKVVKPYFSVCKRFSPEASRNSSSEVYLVCKNFKSWKVKDASVNDLWEEMMDSKLGGNELEEVDSTPSSFKVMRKK